MYPVDIISKNIYILINKYKNNEDIYKLLLINIILYRTLPERIFIREKPKILLLSEDQIEMMFFNN